jgi:acetyltransferase
MPSALSTGIKSFFEPRSIAVAGVSSDPGKLGSIIFSNLRDSVEKGTLKASVYALNPSRSQIGDLPCYPSVGSLPEPPELLIVAVPVSLALDVVKQAANAGVRAVIMITGGFSEVGREDLETEIGRISRGSGMRILGPNTIGLLDTGTGVNSLFLQSTKNLPDGREIVSLLKPLKGNVVVVTQSGHLGEVISEELAANGVGIRALVGTGNQLDVSVEDIIEYFTDDEETKVIALYLEGISDGRRFLKVAAKAAEKKPVVVLKVGKTEVGAKAALTHTASMVGDYELYKALFRRSGVLEAQDFQELVDFSVVLSMLQRVPGRRVVIVTNAGGVGAISADEAAGSGLRVIPLGPRSIRQLRACFGGVRSGGNAVFNNPVDLTASATTDEFVRVTESVLGLPECDLALVLPTHQVPTITFDISSRLSDVVSKTHKPVCMCVMGRSELASRIRGDFSKRGIPSFPTPERAVRALSAVAASRSLGSKARVPATIRTTGSLRGIEGYRGVLPQPKVRELLHAYRILQPASMLARSPRDLAEATRVGFPAACKLLSGQLVHKGEVGGVILSLESPSALKSAFLQLEKLAVSHGLPFEGVLVQRMVGPGVEMILGSTRDPTFGPTIMVGAGGANAELVHDIAVSIAPVTPQEAQELVATTRVGKLQKGRRSNPMADLRLYGVVSRFSRILGDNPTLLQAEVNPLTVTEHGIFAVDTRVVAAPHRQ